MVQNRISKLILVFESKNSHFTAFLKFNITWLVLKATYKLNNYSENQFPEERLCFVSECSKNCFKGQCNQQNGQCSACNEGFFGETCDRSNPVYIYMVWIIYTDTLKKSSKPEI